MILRVYAHVSGRIGPGQRPSWTDGCSDSLGTISLGRSSRQRRQRMTATWPADWDAMVTGRDCSMCAKGRPDDDGFGVRIQAAKYSDAYLQRADMQRGYTLVIWRGRHVTEPTELKAVEASEYWLEVLRVAKALQRYFQPLKMNYEVLGNSLPHLHTHLVPRYLDDPAPGRPFPFLGDERPNLPEDLVQRDAAALRAMLAQADSQPQ
jgi:diadenosine tetraphosphate (Ap4A) HIT family hydrolase